MGFREHILYVSIRKKLFAQSWARTALVFGSNLLFLYYLIATVHLGMCLPQPKSACKSQSSSGHPHLPHCGCPNCNLAGSQSLEACSDSNDYDAAGESEYGGEYGQQGEDEGMYGGQGGAGGGGWGTYGDNSESSGQAGTRTLSLAVYIVGAAALATLVGAMIMRRRVSTSCALFSV